MRTITLWNDNWLFARSGEPQKVVTVPHCYNAVDGQDGSKMYRGTSSYKKVLNISEECLDKYYYLEIGAAELTSAVMVNGTLCGASKIGFSLYRVFLTPYLKAGDNEIEIEVSNEINNSIYPGMADFSFYGGLYRDVKVIADDRIHFSEMDGSRDGILIDTLVKKKENGICEGTLNVSVHMYEEETSSDSDSYVCRVCLLDAEGNVVAEGSAETDVSFGSENRMSDTICTFEISVSDVHLWDGVNDPYLYQLKAVIEDSKGIVYDSRTLTTGFRTVAYEEDRGFLLNDHPYKLHGVAKHQDFGGVGNAITAEHMEKDLELILEMGANAVRCSHYQHCDAWYEMCDRAGLLVWAEVPVISCIPQKAAADENAKEHLDALLAQVRNHISVFCWGVQNEVCMITKNSYTFRLVDELSQICKKADPGRMTAQANEYTTENDCPIMQSTDILGFNYYYGWYYGSIPDLQPRLDAVHEANPGKPMILTEYGVDTNPRFHSAEPKANDYTEEYQLLFSENAINAIEERRFMAGGFVWNMFDFGSAGRDEGGNKGKNQKGLVTIDRKLKKDAYYLYKAHWSAEPFVYLAGRRFLKRAQTSTDITVISNVDRLLLKVNGNTVEEKDREGAMTVFRDVTLLFGCNRIEVFAVDADAQKEKLTDTIDIIRVDEPDPSYVCPPKTNSQNAVNWFEGLDPETMEKVEEAPLREEGYTFDDLLPDIFDNLKAREVFLKYLNPIADGPRFNSAMPISVRKLLSFMPAGTIPESLLIACEQELNRIDK